MRPFLLRTLVALGIAALFHLAFGRFAGGPVDAYYLRFATPRQHALVLGTSRAAQGIHPDVIDAERAAIGYEGPLFNYAFTIAHSPFGPTYLRAIAEKLDTATRNGLFLVSVEPWALCITARDTSASAFPENGRMLGTQWTFNARPNYEYLVRHWPWGWGSLAGWPNHRTDTSATLLPDGRLSITLDPAYTPDRTRRRITDYRDRMFPAARPSERRVHYLERTIDLLRPHGRVVLVRLPVGAAILGMEQRLWPGLDQRLTDLARRHGVQYLDLLPMADSLSFTDGNHLDAVSGERVSRRIAAWLRAEAVR